MNESWKGAIIHIYKSTEGYIKRGEYQLKGNVYLDNSVVSGDELRIKFIIVCVASELAMCCALVYLFFVQKCFSKYAKQITPNSNQFDCVIMMCVKTIQTKYSVRHNLFVFIEYNCNRLFIKSTNIHIGCNDRRSL